jgi:signal transduction histidine kinase
LGLSQLETGQISYRKEPVHVIPFLRRFYDQYELVVRDAGLDFNLGIGKTEDSHPDTLVEEMDAQRVEQVLYNLVSNAMKFTPAGGTVRIELDVDTANEPRCAIIRVQDTGTPPEQLEQIFERHYRYERPGIGSRMRAADSAS